jgi:hypothetical protein
MRKLLLFQLACSAIFLVAAAFVLVYYKTQIPDPPLLQSNSEFVRNIKNLNNVDGLRAVLETVVVGRDRTAVADKAALDATVEFLVTVLLFSGVAFAASFVALLRVHRRQRK